MEIRKADSKGRVTGFEPQTLYVLQASENGEILARPVHNWEQFIEMGII